MIREDPSGLAAGGGSSPARAAAPARFRLADDGRIPNHPRLPLLLWRRVIEPKLDDPAAALEALFARNGWMPAWRDGIWPFPHYHSTAHETLGIARGRVRVRFGGRSGPVLELGAGDVAFIPAGVGHERLAPAPDLLVVGAYPPGQRPDLCRGLPGERPIVLRRIAGLPDPPDPVRGGPLALEAGCRAGRADR